MLSREAAAIAVVKVNRIARTLEYWIDLNTDIFVSVLRDDILALGNLTHDIYDYITFNPSCDALINLISTIPDTYNICEFVKGRRQGLPVEIVSALDKYTIILGSIFEYIAVIGETMHGDDFSIPNELKSIEAKELLHIAVQRGYLNSRYKATSKLKPFQARLLAYALIQKLALKRGAWSSLTRLWYDEDTRISNCYLPHISSKGVQEIVSLFPTVDFSPCWNDSRNLIFKCSYAKEDKQALYDSLKKNGFIEKKTTFKQFVAIFGDSMLVKKVNWISLQLELVYFINLVFRNTHDLLRCRICNCFNVNGKQPNKGSMVTNFSRIVATGRLKTFNPLLYDIARTFNKTNIFEG